MPEGHQLTIDYYEGRRNLGTTVSVEDEENKAASNSNDSVKNKEDIQEVDLVRTETEPETKLSTKQYWWSLLKQGPKNGPYCSG